MLNVIASAAELIIHVPVNTLVYGRAPSCRKWPALAVVATGVVVAYHDSTHEDPLFAVELDLPA